MTLQPRLQTLSEAQAEPLALRARACLVGERIDLRGLGGEIRGGGAMATLRGPDGRTAFVFRYGAAALFGYPPEAEADLLAVLRAHASGPRPQAEIEEAVVQADAAGGTEERIDGEGRIQLASLAADRLQVVAHVLAKSVVLAHYEARIGAVFDQIEPLAESLRRTGRAGPRAGVEGLLRRIGDALIAEHRMVGRVEVDEKPEVLWDHPTLERLYARLADEYELHERALAMERKLAIVNRTTETLLDLVQDRRTTRLEWIIVVLIVIEVVIGAVDLIDRLWL